MMVDASKLTHEQKLNIAFEAYAKWANDVVDILIEMPLDDDNYYDTLLKEKLDEFGKGLIQTAMEKLKNG